MSSFHKREVPHPPAPVNAWMSPFQGYLERRIPVLDFLDYIFKALAVLNEAYLHMYPTPPRHPPCRHEPHQQGPRHLTDMAGQGERMTFIGMLLRTTETIFWLKFNNLQCDYAFVRKVKQEKRRHPEIAHGVAVLNFLTAGMCSNNTQILFGLLHLVQALKEAGKSCEHHHCDVDFFAYYSSRRKSNRTLTLVNKLVDQCTEANCDIKCEFCQKIRQYKEQLNPHLDPEHQKGCVDCECMLVDVLLYAAMFSNTGVRMMASLRLSLSVPKQRQSHEHLKQLKQLTRYLFEEGFTEHHNTTSVDYEILFMSGWQHENVKKEPLHLMIQAFLEREDSRRLFFIQWKHQFIGNDGSAHCCEPQIMQHLEAVKCKLTEARLAQFIDVHMMLEQDPCDTCRDVIVPVILTQLGGHLIPPQLVSMLPFRQGSVFLERLTEDGGPVKLKDDLHPIKARNVCMVHRRCRHVRCHTHCQYSKPSKVLAVDDGNLRSHELQVNPEIPKHLGPRPPHAIMWFMWPDT